MKTYKFKALNLEVMAEDLSRFKLSWDAVTSQLIRAGGHWRLPRIEELEYLYRMSRAGTHQGYPIMDFNWFTDSAYWSSTINGKHGVAILQTPIMIPTYSSARAQGSDAEYFGRAVRDIIEKEPFSLYKSVSSVKL